MLDPITVAVLKTLGEIPIYVSLIGGQMAECGSDDNDDFLQREPMLALDCPVSFGGLRVGRSNGFREGRNPLFRPAKRWAFVCSGYAERPDLGAEDRSARAARLA